MEFEWHEAKAEANLLKHGIDFEDATVIFEGPILQERSDRNEEERWKAIGTMGPIKIAIIYAQRGDSHRIISARRANSHERAAYDQAFPG